MIGKGSGTDLLDVLLAPLRLPERLLAALESLTEASTELGRLHLELTRVRQQAEPLRDLMPAMERLSRTLDSLKEVVVALKADESHLNKAILELGRELTAIHETVVGLRDDVERITDRVPDPSRGPLEKAREVLTGSGD